MAEPQLERLQDRRVIGERLRRDTLVHLYELADLDDFFFRDCSYWAAAGEGPVALLYRGSDPPTLLALARRSSAQLEAVVRALAPTLPDRLYAHFAPGLSAALGDLFDVEPRGTHAKLALPSADPRALAALAPGIEACVPITPADVDSVLACYRDSYPDTWFAPRMLETGAYFGIREGSHWIAIAGVHALSRSERVATLGNVATSPSHRGRGLGRAVCARVCAALAGDVDHIGLNVEEDNHAALACYRALGFEHVSAYEEALLRKR